MTIRRSPGVLAVLLVAMGVASAQQANVTAARMVVNFQDHPSGGTGPINVAVSPGGALVIRITGNPLQRFALVSAAINQPGIALPGYGILDVGFPFFVLLDGFNPTNILSTFALTNPTGSFELAASVIGGTPPSLGLQAAVQDPGSAAGATLTAATSLAVGPFTTSTITIPQGFLGDDVTVTYYHQALSFPFYGVNYGRTNIDTNGYLSFGPPFGSQRFASTALLLGSGPRIAPFWSDLHLSSLTPSAFGIVSQAPASLIITETQSAPGNATVTVDWRFATEAAIAGNPPVGTPGNRYDFRCTLSSNGQITFRYGAGVAAGLVMPAVGNTVSYCGISPGSGLSTNTNPRDLVVGGAVNPFTALAPSDAIFERFDPSAGAFPIDLVAPSTGLTFLPSGGPTSTTYSLF